MNRTRHYPNRWSRKPYSICRAPPRRGSPSSPQASFPHLPTERNTLNFRHLKQSPTKTRTQLENRVFPLRAAEKRQRFSAKQLLQMYSNDHRCKTECLGPKSTQGQPSPNFKLTRIRLKTEEECGQCDSSMPCGKAKRCLWLKFEFASSSTPTSCFRFTPRTPSSGKQQQRTR